MLKSILKQDISEKLLEITPVEIDSNVIPLIKNPNELFDVLNYIPKSENLKFLNLNRNNITKILSKYEEFVKVVKDNINNNILESYFYLYNIISEDLYNINYTYDFEIIKEIYNQMREQKDNLTKFILHIFAYIIIYNYEGIDRSSNSSTDNEIEKIKKEIEEFIQHQESLITEFQLSIDINELESFKIDYFYSQAIITLIRNKKISDYKYAKEILEQLGLYNIELTHQMYLLLKKEFDENFDKEYLSNYKIVAFDDLINFNIINFYYLLFKYIFKVTIYIYNISFLLESKKSIIKIAKKNCEKLLTRIANYQDKDMKERIHYVLKMFLDVYYEYLLLKTNNLDNNIKKLIHEKKFNKIRNKKDIFTLLDDKKTSERISKLFTNDEIETFKNKYNTNNDLYEINNYFKNYFFQSKQKDILKITEFLQGNINLKYKEKKEYLKDLNIAKEMNNKYKFFNNIFELKNIENEKEIKNILNQFDKMLSEKNIDILDDEKKIKLFKYINNKSELKKFEALLKEDSFEFLENEKNKGLNEILLYFKTFFPESKKNEIESIENGTFKNDIFNEY